MTTIKIIENGPAIIEGEIAIFTSNEEEVADIRKQKIAICRCGKSTNQPYCDGSHKPKKEQ